MDTLRLQDTVTVALDGAPDAADAPRVARTRPSWPPVRAAARWVEQARAVAVRLARPPSAAIGGDVCLDPAGA